MNPRDFYEFAHRTAARSSEAAALRTATSRAYYAAFHLSRRFLTEIGVRIEANVGSHQLVKDMLLACCSPVASSIGGLLGDLRSARLKADYELDHRNAEKPDLVRQHLEIASEVLDRLDKCAAESTEMRKDIEAYLAVRGT